MSVSTLIRLGLQLILVFNIADAKKRLKKKKLLICLSITILWAIIIFSLDLFYEGIPWYISLFNLMIFFLKLLILYLGISLYFILRNQLFAKFLLYLFIMITCIVYLDLLIERCLIIKGLEHISFEHPIFWYFNTNKRFPKNINEAKEYSEFNKMMNEFCKYIDSNIDLGLVRIPEFGIKTFLEDSVLICKLYSYGFDNDDDNGSPSIDLKNEIREYHPFLLWVPKIFWYVVAPIPLDGDILLCWMSSPTESCIRGKFVAR